MKTRRYARIKGGEPNFTEEVNVHTLKLPNYNSNTVIQPAGKLNSKQYVQGTTPSTSTDTIKRNFFSIVKVARNPTRSTSPPPKKEMVTNIAPSQQQVESVVIPKYGLQRLSGSRSLPIKGGKRYSKTRKHRKNRK